MIPVYSTTFHFEFDVDRLGRCDAARGEDDFINREGRQRTYKTGDVGYVTTRWKRVDCEPTGLQTSGNSRRQAAGKMLDPVRSIDALLRRLRRPATPGRVGAVAAPTATKMA